MKNIKKNSIYFLFISAVLILLAFSMLSSFGVYSHCIDSAHSQNMCQMQVLAKTLNVAVLPSTILAAFVLVIVLAALTTDILKSLLNLTGYYLKQIFQLFGSFLLFNYLILILKQGILHPKTF